VNLGFTFTSNNGVVKSTLARDGPVAQAERPSFSIEQLPLNPPDTLLHLASMILTGYIGFLAKSPEGKFA
jgi:hypothetical protein